MIHASKASVAIIILTMNQRDKTMQCLSSLYAMRQELSFRVVLWDNGSQDDTITAVQEADSWKS